MSDAQVASAPAARAGLDLVGEFRRFGPHGVAYEVVAALDGAWVELRVIETGERLRYAASDVRRDPRA